MTGLILAQIVNGLAVGMSYALLALGLSIIKGLLNIPNFAHGALYALGAYFCAAMLEATGSFAGALVVAFLGAAVVGVLIERLGVSQLLHSAYLFQLLLLFGIALILEQLILIIWGTQGRSFPPPEFLQGAFDLGTTFIPKYLIFTMVFSGVAILAVWLLIERTAFGSRIRAGIDKREMAQALGIDVERLFTVGFGLGAGLAGLAGGLAVPMLGATSTMGTDMLSIAFVVVVVGGLGSLYGAILAGVLIGLVQSLAAIWVPQASTVLIYAAMVAILAIRPQGLLGER